MDEGPGQLDYGREALPRAAPTRKQTECRGPDQHIVIARVNIGGQDGRQGNDCSGHEHPDVRNATAGWAPAGPQTRPNDHGGERVGQMQSDERAGHQ